MDFKSKKGFITIYVMLAMMFFIVFVVTATVTASRKIKLQEEANKALYDIYNEEVDAVLQDVRTIPIYSKAQFIQIAKWMVDKSEVKYIYSNNVLYKLDHSRYDDDTVDETTGKITDEDGNNYIFDLKTDLYFDGIENYGADKDYFKYIMNDASRSSNNNWIHQILKKDYESVGGTTGLPQEPIMDIGIYDEYNDEYNVYLFVNNQRKNYGEEKIYISTGEEFLKIGQGNVLIGDNARYFPDNGTYELQNNIEISDEDLNGIDFGERKEFKGTLNGNNKVVELSGKMLVGKSGNAGFFSINSGEINQLTFVCYSPRNESILDIRTGIDNFGMFAGINKGEINNCNVLYSKKQTDDIIVDANGCSITNFGVMVGTNEGYINENNSDSDICDIQGIKVQRLKTKNLGIVAGKNSGRINKVYLTKCEIDGSGITAINDSNRDINIGLITGLNSSTNVSTNVINDAIIDDCILNNMQSPKDDSENVRPMSVGGAVGKNCGTVQNVEMKNKFELKLTNDAKYVGGIVGNNENSVERIKIDCNFIVNSTNGVQEYVGGIVGLNNSGTISGVKVNSENNSKAYIEIKPNSDMVFLGGVTGSNEGNGDIDNCYITGIIDDKNNKKSTTWHCAGGIAGRSVGGNQTDSRDIEDCYSNVRITHHNSSITLGTGGIVGVIGWNGAKGSNNIKDSAYVSEIIVQSKDGSGNWKDASIVGTTPSSSAVGGIVGTYWLGGADTLEIDGCYMNGKIPISDHGAGALIGVIGNQYKSSDFSITIGASYNQAYKWIGYATQTASKVTVNCANLTARSDSDLNSLINDLKNDIWNGLNF